MVKLRLPAKSIVVTFLLVAAFGKFSFSQGSQPAKDYSKYPYWIEMMDDSTVNYFEAVKAYDEFWANRKKPREEDEIIGEKKKKSLWDRIFSTKAEKQEAESNKYKFLCKKFEHWKFTVQPYVQPDGRILSTGEQLELWKKQRSGN
jgi:hypothetical protein